MSLPDTAPADHATTAPEPPAPRTRPRTFALLGSELALLFRRRRTWAMLGALALVIDYGLLPRKLSPGWHLALSRSSVLMGFMSMSLGLGLGGVAARRLVIGANR